MSEEVKRPRVDADGQKKLDVAAEAFKDFDKNVKALTSEREMNLAPKEEENQTKLSQNELRNAQDIYLKPIKSINVNQKFNEKFRDAYNFAKEYVMFIAEHKEIIGEEIDIWTKPFPGMPAEEWLVPTNKPIWGPRYLAEQISKKSYNRLVMNESTQTTRNQYGVMTGQLAIDTRIKRLDAYPATRGRSVFMSG